MLALEFEFAIFLNVRSVFPSSDFKSRSLGVSGLFSCPSGRPANFTALPYWSTRSCSKVKLVLRTNKMQCKPFPLLWMTLHVLIF
jgi:hypothetical protein